MDFLIPAIVSSLVAGILILTLYWRSMSTNLETNSTTQEHANNKSDRGAGASNKAEVVRGVSKMTGVEQLILTLKSHGVEFLFALTGSDVFPILVEADAKGIRVIGVRHESSAVYAAKATGRLTGRPGIVVVTAGPGVVNTMQGAEHAKFDEVPVIIFGGAVATMERGTGALHDIGDTLTLMRPTCKQVFSVEKTSEMIQIVRKAFQVAVSDTPGPVFVQLPKDVLAPYVSDHVDINRTPSTFNQLYQNPTRFMSKGLDNFQANVLFNRWVHHEDPYDPTPLPVHIPMAKETDIHTSAKILKSAKKPFMCIGSQVTLSPERLGQVSEALDSLGIPCYLRFTAKGLLGNSNDLLLQYDVESALALADVVILAGMPTDVFFNFGYTLPKNGKIISVGRNKKTLTLNSPKVWRPTQVIHGDVGRYLVELSEALAKENNFSVDPVWIKKCQSISLEKEAYYEKTKPTEVHLNPVKLLFELDASAPQDVIYAMDVGDFAFTAEYILRPPRPLSYIAVGPFANVGAGIGTALGAKLCYPDAPVWLVTGDGGIGFHIMELDTCFRYNIRIMALVGNDAAWFEIERKEFQEFGTTVGASLTYANYHKVATALGAKGFILDRKDGSRESEVGKQFAIAHTQNQKKDEPIPSVLINALMGTTDIRDGFA